MAWFEASKYFGSSTYNLTYNYICCEAFSAIFTFIDDSLQSPLDAEFCTLSDLLSCKIQQAE
jgi:hypothetical protein